MTLDPAKESADLPLGRKKIYAGHLFRLSRIALLFYLLLFPFGMSFREIGAWTATSAVLLLYALDFPSTNARRMGRLFWVFPAFWAFLVFKTVTSISPSTSWYALQSNVHMGFGLFFVGLEFVRRETDLRLPVYAMAASGCVQGLDGVWQAAFGRDFFYGAKPLGVRLTGTFSTYRVGNLLSLYMPPMAGLFWALPQRIARHKRLLATAAVLAPALFLLMGSRTRSAMIGLGVALLVAWFAMRRSWWKALLVLCVAAALVVAFGPYRFSLEGVMNDPRIQDLWPLGLKVFANWPLLGSGVETYNNAFRSLGLKPFTVALDIPHPHNVYLQLLCETGIIGLAFFLGMVFLLLRFAGKRVLPRARAGSRWWSVAALFLAAYVGYLATGVSGHSFFRNWWLGTALLLLGLALGFCAASTRPEFGGGARQDRR